MPTSNRDMNDMMRRRRRELDEIPGEGSVYEPPSGENDRKPDAVAIAIKPVDAPDEELTEPVDNPEEEAAEGTESAPGLTVLKPGEPSDGESYEYAPNPDVPGAWVVYPPGVPCDESAYRITMQRPARAGDFEQMEEALRSAGAETTGPEEIPEDNRATY